MPAKISAPPHTPAPAITVPSPNGRWKRAPSARAKRSASTPSARVSWPASTKENEPNVLTIRRSAPAAARRCSKFRIRAACAVRRSTSAAMAEGAPAGEAALGLVPVLDRVLALLPAQVHLAALANGGEVEQPAIEV